MLYQAEPVNYNVLMKNETEHDITLAPKIVIADVRAVEWVKTINGRETVQNCHDESPETVICVEQSTFSSDFHLKYLPAAP